MIRLGVLMWVWLIAGAAGVLFHVSYDVTALDDELAALNRDIVREQEAIRVLRAEWSFLNQPERLRLLAQELTTLAPIGPAQVIETAATLPMPLPEPDSEPVDPAALDLVVARIVGTEDPVLQTILLPPPKPDRRALPAARPASQQAAPATPAPATAATVPAPAGDSDSAAEPGLDRGGLASLLTDLGIEPAPAGDSQ